MGDLVTDPAGLAARVAQVRDALTASASAWPDEIELRVAASVAHLGLTARLVAPVLGLAVLGDADPAIDLAEVYWQAELGGPFPLSLPGYLLASRQSRPGPLRSPAAAPHVLRTFLEGPALALVQTTLLVTSFAPHVLWGNVASAVHSAGQMIRIARPEFGQRVTGVVDEALAHPLLRNEHHRPGGRFRRRSCCLIYRISAPGPIGVRGLCGDCVLAA